MYRHNQHLRKIMRLLIPFLGLFLPFATQAQLIRNEVTSPDGTGYLLFVPESYNPANSYPLLVYLHGAQAMGNSISCSFGKGLPGAIQNTANDFFDTLNMIIVAPHVNAGSSCSFFDNDYEWDPLMVDEVVQDVLGEYTINTDRIFGSGISLGAKGIWDYALAFPDLFAGLIPISGNAPIEDICTLDETAVWAFHGESDGTIPISGGEPRKGSLSVVEAINACSSAPYLPAYLTTFEAKGHNGWDQLYDLSAGYNIYEWMLSLDRNSSSNYNPLVKLGQDVTLINPAIPYTIKSFSYDPNGSIVDYNWSQLTGSPISFTNGQPSITLNLSSTSGTYAFELEVTDNENNTASDQITIEVTNISSTPRVTELRLYDGLNNEDLGPITNNQVIDANSYNLELLDVLATVENLNSRASVRFALNDNNNFTTLNDDKIPGGFYSIGNNNHKLFNPTTGEYTITATAYGNRNAIDQGGSFQVTFALSENPLPITLVNFTAHMTDNQIVFDWTTATENNNSHFELYQRTTTNEMKKMASIPKSDSHEALRHYRYVLPIHTCNRQYFQLQSVDYDGHRDYSRIITVNNNSVDCAWTFYPNPVVDHKITVKAKNLQEGLQLFLLNTVGQIVREYTVHTTTNIYQLGLDNLPSGLYYLQAISPQGHTEKLGKVIIP